MAKLINYSEVAREMGVSEKNVWSKKVPKKLKPVIEELEKSAKEIINKHKNL